MHWRYSYLQAFIAIYSHVLLQPCILCFDSLEMTQGMDKILCDKKWCGHNDIIADSVHFDIYQYWWSLGMAAKILR